jgi:hypothetical protein
MMTATAVVTTALVAGACGGASGAAGDPVAYGPPPGSNQVEAMGTMASGDVANLVFVDTTGTEYLVHTGSAVMVAPSADPARTATTLFENGSDLTLTCGGTSRTSNSAVDQVAGPLAVSWHDGHSVVTVLSQDATGPCAPTMEAAQPLIDLVRSLPRLTADEWSQLVRDHPIDLRGGPEAVEGPGTGSVPPG